MDFFKKSHFGHSDDRRGTSLVAKQPERLFTY
jgi:hypothetical protein